MEEVLLSGNSSIEQATHTWHWHIPLYLFLGGIAAGLLFFSALYTLLGKENKYKTTVKTGPLIACIAIVIGLVALLLDLTHKPYFWRLYTTLRLESPMSWGAWTLMIITPLAFFWSASFFKEIIPKIRWQNFIVRMIFIIPCKKADGDVNWDWRWNWLRKFELFISRQRRNIAKLMVVLAPVLGIYTGILLSAFNARPLWNTSILGPIFLVSGLSTAAALIMLLSRNHDEKKLFGKIDLAMIIVELFLITHLFMGFLASNAVQIESAMLFLGGEFTMPFWVFVIGLGLILPAILEYIEMRGIKIPTFIIAILVLIGGAMFRFIMVEAGQVSGYVL